MSEGESDVERQRVMAAVRGRLFGASSSTLFVGRYELRERLGEGGAGVVYRAYDPRLDREVALKLMAPAGVAMAEDDSVRRARLLREARAMARLSHPHVVAVHDVGEHDGQVFVAMELVEGETFGDWRRRARPDLATLLEVAAGAGEGLAAAHDGGLLHRDFKPDNVLVDRYGVAKVLDFGLVTTTEPGERPRNVATDVPLSARLTRTGAVLGTPAYMAREQLVGGTVDERTDQYAFCAMLYEALYDERPYRGDTLEMLLRAIVSAEPPSPPQTDAVPGALREAVLRGLASDATKRFGSMRELLDALRAAAARPSLSVPRPILFGGVAAVAIAALVAIVIVIVLAAGDDTPPIEPAPPSVDAAGQVAIDAALPLPMIPSPPRSEPKPVDAGVSDVRAPRRRTAPEARPAPVTAADVAYPGRVNSVATSNQHQIDFCVQGRADGPNPRGTIVVAFAVTPDGRAEGVRVVQDTTGDQGLSACVVRAVRRWDYPLPPGGQRSDQRLSFRFDGT